MLVPEQVDDLLALRTLPAARPTEHVNDLGLPHALGCLLRLLLLDNSRCGLFTGEEMAPAAVLDDGAVLEAKGRC